MNHDELVNVLKIINTASVNGKSKDDATATVLRLAAESFTKDILRSLMEAKNIEDKNGNALTTEKESQMLIEAKGVSITSKPRRDGRFQGYIIQDDGQRKYFYGRNYEDVTNKIREFLRNNRSRRQRTPQKVKPRKKSSPMFLTYMSEWIEIYKKPNLKPSSLQSLKKSLKYAEEAFQDKTLDDITSNDIQKLLVGIKAERIRDMCKINLSQLFKKAVIQGIIKNNPCDAVEIKRHKASHKKALTRAEQETFLRAASQTKYSLLYRFLLSTGLRIGEALALKRSDFDFEKGIVSVNKNVVFVNGEKIEQTPKSDAGYRIVPVPRSICDEIKCMSGDAIFPYSYNAVRKATERIAKETGLNVTLHILRHTYATRLEEGNIQPKLKQYLLGHASLEVTQNIYTDTTTEYLESVSGKIQNVFCGI